MQNILITGGAGYIGSACLRWMLNKGYNVYAFDNLSEGNKAAIPDAESRLIIGNILDFDLLVSTLKEKKIDAVMHFAAAVSVPESINDPEFYWRTNVSGTKTVLDAMVATNVKKLVFSSTAATYSFESPMPLQFDSAQAPTVPYGVTKLACESIIKDYAKTYEIGCSIMRYFNAAGADPSGQFGESRKKESHLIPLVLLTALGKRDTIYVFGTDWETPDQTCIRDFVHVDDISNAHELSLNHIKPHKVDAYNIGLGKGVSVREIITISESIIGKKINSIDKPRRAGDPGILYTNPQKLKDELGWAPKYNSIEEIIKSAWNWHKSHPNGY
ncbi:UDP-glucose 4-epimerase GalE [Candidatus Marinamargulisbacteria bacterium SCGC AAA071-K20]|nr:UDP-glucose 4-epimerase GalE [Candidatus Marinamargulisbacteria bacterium SCGC AAA071-K20]